MHRPTNTWWRRNMVCLSADQIAENHLESNGVDVKRSKLEARSGILTWKWILEFPDQLWNHVEMRECRQQRHRWKFLQYLHLHLRLNNTYMKCEVKECAKALRIRAFWSEIGRTPGCPACEAPGPGKSHTRECKTFQDAWEDSRRTASAEEARRGIVGDPNTRPQDPSSSSTDPNPKRSKTTSVTDNDSLANQMDEDNFQRGPATSHQLEPVDDENVPKKARVARNVFSIRGKNGVKFDVNEEAWPNADLAIRGTYEGTLIDGLPADKVKAGDEREIVQMKDLQLYSWVKETDIPPNKIDSAHRLGSTIEGERSEIEMCAEGFRDDSER